MLLFIAALRRELARIEALAGDLRWERLGDGLFTEGAIRGTPMMLARSGVGKERAQRAAALALERRRPSAVVSLGFGGAALPHVKAGDLVIADRIRVEGESERAPVFPDPALFQRTTDALERNGARFHTGELLTAAKVLGPARKAEAGGLLNICAVDMETYWVGEAAASRGIPFLAVRAVTDEVADALPDFQRFVNGAGEVRLLRAAAHFLTHPRQVALARMLAGNARRAAESLGMFASYCHTPVYESALLGASSGAAVHAREAR